MPFIVCDRPDPEQMVEYYTIAGLPGDPESPLSASIEYGVKYDISDVPPGTYNIRVSACNQWRCSLPSPLDFTVPDEPSIPTNIRLVF